MVYAMQAYVDHRTERIHLPTDNSFDVSRNNFQDVQTELLTAAELIHFCIVGSVVLDKFE